MTEKEQADIKRRAQTDATMMRNFKQPVFCPYTKIDQAIWWKQCFDVELAALKVRA